MPETTTLIYEEKASKKRTYKSAHSIGSRKVTEKVITYSDALPFLPSAVQQQQQQQRQVRSAVDASMEQKKSSPTKRKRADTSSPDREIGKKKARRDSTPGDATPTKGQRSGKSTPVKSTPVKKSPTKTSPEKTTPKKTSPTTTPKKSPAKKKPARDTKKVTGAQKRKKREPVRRKQKEAEQEKKAVTPSSSPKKNSDPDSDAGKKKKAKKTVEKEIPSLMSFIKPRREASLNASAMVNIMFEKLPSPKKDGGAKSPAKSPAKQSPRKEQEKTAPKATADKAQKASLKSQTERKRAESQRNKSPKTPTKKKAAGKDGGDKLRTKAKADAGKVVKRKTKSRMASLNARALIVAERESMQVAMERAARTDRYCVSWKHETPPEGPRLHQEAARWVDGLGDTCCIDHYVSSVCSPKKEMPSPGADTAVPTNIVSDLKTPVINMEKDIVADDRPSSVVDVVGAHSTPIKAPVLASSACNYGNFGGLFGPSAACGISAFPGYSYSHTEGYVTQAGYQSFTLSGMGTLGGVPMMPTYRTSAFSVPYNTTLPYSYYPSGYYQPTASPLLTQPMPQPACLLPHHVPHAQIKVLIHNPDTPQDLPAFSEPTPARKNGGSGVESSPNAKNDSNNNSGSFRGNSAAKSNGGLPSKSNGSVNGKSNGSVNSKANGSVNGKPNGSLNGASSASGKKSKKESHVVLKNKEANKQTKRRYEKKKSKNEKEAAEPKQEVTEKKEKAPDHGWTWVGEGEMKPVPNIHIEHPPTMRMCYQAIQHKDGEIVRVRDCVLLRSGPGRSDVPYVAKVGALWSNPDNGEIMMSLLWYYQPEHTEAGRQSHDVDCEVFASRHRDENSVACIDDKCYVLTYNQYCR
nr:hypothetical protein BaRGS_006887 [Batillaria attramentaria]